jgi:thermostable 8-oxoguanine DNA glycosylase
VLEKANEEIDLVVLDRHIQELNQRIDDLKERMTTMASQKYETKNQSILLSTMQEVMKDLKLLRLEMLNVLGGEDANSQACLRAG